MIYTIEQANNHNTLLDIKERIEERYKEGFNIINRMPRITFISNIEADKATPVDKIKPAYKANEDKKESPVDEINQIDKINYRSQVGVVYEPNLEIEIEFETSPPSLNQISKLKSKPANIKAFSPINRDLRNVYAPALISICSVGNVQP
jgi:hypothetical protein